uniref:Phospholipase B1, membrane-associated-like n=1 Tax=Scleropages formosus TaxID=113540 RepID=A0A8C9R674_SCLFO
MVWPGGPSAASRDDSLCSCTSTHNAAGLRLRKAALAQALQESLERHLEERLWYGDRDDFAVQLQGAPLDTGLDDISGGEAPPTGKSVLDTDGLAIQLWTNLLQPMAVERDRDVVGTQCQREHQPFLRTWQNSPPELHLKVRTRDQGSNAIPHMEPVSPSFFADSAHYLWPDAVLSARFPPNSFRPWAASSPVQTEAPPPHLRHQVTRLSGQQGIVGIVVFRPCFVSLVTSCQTHVDPPCSVHALRPADVKVVAALGDSLTAANGAGGSPNNILDVIVEYRGISWSIGGDDNLTSVTTLPNILREFNPSLTGYSVGTGKEHTPSAFLNQAVAGSNTDDMPQQARLVADMMKNDPRIDFHNDWKVITMFIGGNDLCDHCTDSVYYSAENLVSNIRQALDILHQEVPRALVNLVELMDIMPIYHLHQDNSLRCPTWLINLFCRCVVKPAEHSAELQTLKDLNQAYQRGMRDLVDSGRYDTHSNFTVVLQPFFHEVVPPRLEDGRLDRSYFASDCFHLSQKSHGLMARALWNNMLEPLGNKTSTYDFSSDIPFMCPSEDSPFLRTYQNSDYTYKEPDPTPPAITNWGSDFPCSVQGPSDPVPTSVHRLRPEDIKVVASLGDSLTAGFGAKSKNLLELTTEYRGVSWSIGGDETLETVTTLPNILRKFNPSLMGFSRGRGDRQKGFNLAVSGAKSSDIPAQVQSLIQALKDSEDVDFDNDWKLVTLFIGANDLCQYCEDRASLSLQNYSRYLQESLDMLYKEAPRMMVNILGVLQVDGLRRVKRDTLGCSLLQKYACPCVLIPGEDSMELSELRRINREFQAETERLVWGGRYDGREDFTVVFQPYFQNTVVPLAQDGTPDLSFFSVDCFHITERGHAEMAISLWNNMLEPVGRKQAHNNFTYDRKKIQCPTEDQPFIFTRTNSFPGMPAATTTATSRPPYSSTTLAPVTLRSDSLPLWMAPLLAVMGLIVGSSATWLLLSRQQRRIRKKMTDLNLEMKGTGL